MLTTTVLRSDLRCCGKNSLFREQTTLTGRAEKSLNLDTGVICVALARARSAWTIVAGFTILTVTIVRGFRRLMRLAFTA